MVIYMAFGRFHLTKIVAQDYGNVNFSGRFQTQASHLYEMGAILYNKPLFLLITVLST